MGDSRWRPRCREVIEQTIALTLQANPAATRTELLAAVRSAYPFGQRKYHPYKIWLSEVKAQLPKPAPYYNNPKIVIWPDGVRCEWCNSNGCLLCSDACGDLRRMRPDVEAYLALAKKAKDEPFEQLILADWLEERGFADAAEIMRT